jgi:hypothetical protein
MFSRKLTRFVAAGVAAVAIAIGGVAIANSTSSNGASGTTNSAQAAAPSQGPRAGQFGPGQGPRSGQGAPGQGARSQAAPTGQVPQGWQPGSGTLITGAAADKAKAAALAAGYQGTVNRVLKLSDGSYAVHMFATSGPHHVFVGKDFKVTGTA